MIFSVVSYIIKIMFYIRCYPNETIMVGAYELRRRRYERGSWPILTSSDVKRNFNFIYKQ